MSPRRAITRWMPGLPCLALSLALAPSVAAQGADSVDEACYFPSLPSELTVERKIDYAIMVEALDAGEAMEAFVECFLADTGTLVSLCEGGDAGVFREVAARTLARTSARTSAQPVVTAGAVVPGAVVPGGGLAARRDALRAELADAVAGYAEVERDGCWGVESAHCAGLRERLGSAGGERAVLERVDAMRWELADVEGEIEEAGTGG